MSNTGTKLWSSIIAFKGTIKLKHKSTLISITQSNTFRLKLKCHIKKKNLCPRITVIRGLAFFALCSRISQRIQKSCQNYFSMRVRGLGGVDWWKKIRVKSLVALSLEVEMYSSVIFCPITLIFSAFAKNLKVKNWVPTTSGNDTWYWHSV